ncbi:hypothetical protein EKK58_05990 [Candidatus Dependentiae bacterium]|nr:MAG: hypothetical protein EKK58_05990 [Candidatus Dependentiae bacterium]
MKEDYLNYNTTVSKIAKKYGLTSRSLQRAMKNLGVVRERKEATRLSVKHKDYSWLRKPEELKVKRKSIPQGLRYKILRAHPYCSVCGATYQQCPLSIDHIDNNPTNNNENNLQVLCLECNYGKYALKE